jgi:peptidoglycan LD-endopeptidase CwlK
MYSLGSQSLTRLTNVDPKLVSVVKRAIQLTKQDFLVLEGVRTKEQCYINWGKGRTIAELKAAGVPIKYAQPNMAKVTWLKNPLNSKHCIQATGYGHAVDLVPYPVDWNDLKKFDEIAKAMQAAAKELKVNVRWGADWDADGKPRERGETDSPHFEI